MALLFSPTVATLRAMADDAGKLAAIADVLRRMLLVMHERLDCLPSGILLTDLDAVLVSLAERPDEYAAQNAVYEIATQVRDLALTHGLPDC